MSSVAEASLYVRMMVNREAVSCGDRNQAMRDVARNSKVGFWTLDHLRKRKAKTVDAAVYARIKSAFADQCMRHAKRLLHEAEIAKAVNRDVDLATIENQIRALESQLAAAKSGSKARADA